MVTTDTWSLLLVVLIVVLLLLLLLLLLVVEVIVLEDVELDEDELEVALLLDAEDADFVPLGVLSRM